MPHHRSLRAFIPGALLTIGASALIAAGGSSSGARSAGRLPSDLTSAGIARFQTFVPELPADLPAAFGVSVRLGDRHVRLDVRKHSNRGDRFQVLVDVGDGRLERVADPVIRTYVGEVEGQPGSQVALSLLPLGPDGRHVLSGMVHEADGRSWALQPMNELVEQARRVPVGTHVSYASEDTFLEGAGCAFGRPGFDMDAYRSPLSRARAAGGMGGGGGDGSDEGGIAGLTPSQVEISCDTDYEFFQRNSSSVANTVNDIEQVLNSVNTVYDRDVNIVFEIGTLVVRSTTSDPYTSTTMDGRLTEFGNKWATAPESGIFRDISHLFSGFAYSGSAAGTLGIAYLGGMCSSVSQAQYGAVQGRQSSTTSNFNNRVALSAHELGHNWDATHCDSQGSANCNIMCSGLGGCGGISGSNLRFNTLSISEINAHRNAVNCDFTRPEPVSLPFDEPFATTTLSTIRWTYNDGGAVSQAAVSEPSAPYSLALNSTGSGIYDQDEVRTNFMLLSGVSGARASVKVQRAAGVEAGKSLIVEYLNSSLDWVALETIVSDGVAQTQFTAYEWTLPANASHNRFRLRFRAQGADSSDIWYVDDVRVATAPPCPSDFNGSGQVDAVDLATVLANWGGPGNGDIDGSGTVDGVDLARVLAAWGPCP